jgi:hypothetical protein
MEHGYIITLTEYFYNTLMLSLGNVVVGEVNDGHEQQKKAD